MEIWFMVLGILIGCIAAVIGFSRLIIGVLRVDTSDPYDQPYMFLELSKSANTVMNKKYVILKVSTENYISQK